MEEEFRDVFTRVTEAVVADKGHARVGGGAGRGRRGREGGQADRLRAGGGLRDVYKRQAKFFVKFTFKTILKEGTYHFLEQVMDILHRCLLYTSLILILRYIQLKKSYMNMELWKAKRCLDIL